MILHLKSTIFLDFTPCSLVEFYIGFGGTYYLYLQVLKVK